jgi:hypothetical protein
MATPRRKQSRPLTEFFAAVYGIGNRQVDRRNNADHARVRRHDFHQLADLDAGVSAGAGLNTLACDQRDGLRAGD